MHTRSIRHSTMTPTTLLALILGAMITLITLVACGSEDDDDFACCNGGRYYSCPNKSAALVCDDSLDPQTVCDFEPANNDLCR